MVGPGENVICKEVYGCRVVERSYVRHGDSIQIQEVGSQQNRRLKNALTVFKEIFLPQGYPDSVSEDYLTYQMWDTIQAFCSSVTGTLSCHAVLKGVGVGDESATVAAATLTWLMKEGSGMVGRIVFAWCRGTQLDQKCKMWRFRADVLNDFALTLDLISPSFPSMFRVLTCVSSISKSFVGVAGGATRAALTVHQARRDNMGDVAAKDGSQETLVNLLGLVAGLIFTPLLDGNPWLIWTLFVLFTIMHVFANYRAVTCVVMETINEDRLKILVSNFIKTGDGTMMSRVDVNKLEPVFSNWDDLIFPVHLGVPLNNIVNNYSDFDAAIRHSASDSYMIGFNKNGSVEVVLHRDITSVEMIKAVFQTLSLHGLIMTTIEVDGAHVRTSDSYRYTKLIKHLLANDAPKLNARLSESRSQTLNLFPKFVTLAEGHGWTLSKNLLGPSEWRADWNKGAKKQK